MESHTRYLLNENNHLSVAGLTRINFNLVVVQLKNPQKWLFWISWIPKIPSYMLFKHI